MTTGNGTPGPHRLNRVEAILAALAERQAAVQAAATASVRAADAAVRAAEVSSASISALGPRPDERLVATQAIVDSNARTIKANSVEAAAQCTAQAVNEQTITNAVLGMLDMGEGMMTRIDDLGRRMDQNFAEHNRRIEDLYRAQGHILRRLFGEDSTDS